METSPLVTSAQSQNLWSINPPPPIFRSPQTKYVIVGVRDANRISFLTAGLSRRLELTGGIGAPSNRQSKFEAEDTFVPLCKLIKHCPFKSYGGS
jgi:hypothetical protein